MSTIQRLLIKVTDYDLKHGIMHSCYCCPVATAISRHVVENNRVSVGSNWITIIERGTCNELWSVKTNPMVSDFIKRFDNVFSKQYCKPFEFEIELIDNVLLFPIINNQIA